MAIEGFDFKQFAKTLAEQAGQVIPAQIDESDKQYIVNIVFNFSYMAGEALFNDPNLNFNAQQASVVTQFIGEWSFHKAIDLIKGGIDPQFRDAILQKIAFTVFEIGKQAILKEMTQDDMINIVEFHVKKAYAESLQELQKNGALSDEQYNNAVNCSNIDEMAKQVSEDAQAAQQSDEYANNMSDNKILKLATLAMVIKRLPENKRAAVLKKMKVEDAGIVQEYARMEGLEEKLDQNVSVKCLEDIKKNLPEPRKINTGKVYEKLYLIVKNSDISKISNIIRRERDYVKKVVLGTAQEGEIEIPPRIVDIICQHLEDKIG